MERREAFGRWVGIAGVVLVLLALVGFVAVPVGASPDGHPPGHAYGRTSGPYDPYNVGAPSGNGNGAGGAVGRPDAGTVGNADAKNPPGQLPGGSDANAGYECDRNAGVGRTNPAHTSCAPPPTTVPPTTAPPTTAPPPPVSPTTVPQVTTVPETAPQQTTTAPTVSVLGESFRRDGPGSGDGNLPTTGGPAGLLLAGCAALLAASALRRTGRDLRP